MTPPREGIDAAEAAGSPGPGPGPGPDLSDRLRALPSVEALAGRLADLPRALAVEAARCAVAERREALLAQDRGLRASDRLAGASDRLAGASDRLAEDPDRLADDPDRLADDPDRLADDLEARARALAREASRARLRPVVNATGVIVHTNLGRAPLPAAAVEAVTRTSGRYSNLEYDLGAGARGSRQAHVADLVREVTGAEAGLVVNNCAAAVLLAAAALAGGREIVVSRGQLVEIGGSFRVPEVVAQSGAELIEVGTTNRTRLDDYRRALGPDTGAIMRAHPSNFRTLGFVEEVEIEPLCEVAREAGVPVIDDVGSGAIAERVPELADEPPVRRSVAAGCAVVCFSGDKLLGGPQAGLMAGSEEAIERCRRHPLARAVRIDKLSLAALEATLRLYRDPAAAAREIPVLRMLTVPESELARRAEAMRAALADSGVAAQVVTASGRVGGGALPLVELEGPVCAVDPAPLSLEELARRLRDGDPPVVGRVREGWLILDPRTLGDEEATVAVSAVVAARR